MRQPAGDAHAVAAPDHAVIGRPARNGQIEPVVAQDLRHPGLCAWPLNQAESTSSKRGRSTGDSKSRR